MRHVLLLSFALLACGESGSVIDEVAHPYDGFVELNGASLQYRDWGGEGQLMVLLPSLGMTSHVFETLAPMFTDHYRVMALTRRWHGASEGARLDFDMVALANDVAEFIRTFTDEPAVVLGWGWATLEQMSLARNHPDLVEAIVLANGPTVPSGGSSGIPRPVGQFAADTIFPSIEAAVDAWSPYLRVDRAVHEELLSAALVPRDNGTYVFGPPVGTRAMARFVEVEIWERTIYEGVEAPVLAIQVRQADYLERDLENRGFSAEDVSAARMWAEEVDDVQRGLGIDRLLSVIPTAEVVELRGVSHNFILEAPESVGPIVLEFLDRVR